ncbi:MAG TPA: hypothetical protein VLH09_12325 [Bryobacteraceae bacterium]|nr:hypothetical protein [Bryobacteraceae bacterium]
MRPGAVPLPRGTSPGAASANPGANIETEGGTPTFRTWEEFCKQHAGASRAHADQIIRRIEEFGAALQALIRYTFNRTKRLARAG